MKRISFILLIVLFNISFGGEYDWSTTVPQRNSFSYGWGKCYVYDEYSQEVDSDTHTPTGDTNFNGHSELSDTWLAQKINFAEAKGNILAKSFEDGANQSILQVNSVAEQKAETDVQSGVNYTATSKIAAKNSFIGQYKLAAGAPATVFHEGEAKFSVDFIPNDAYLDDGAKLYIKFFDTNTVYVDITAEWDQPTGKWKLTGTKMFYDYINGEDSEVEIDEEYGGAGLNDLTVTHNFSGTGDSSLNKKVSLETNKDAGSGPQDYVYSVSGPSAGADSNEVKMKATLKVENNDVP